jgi:N-acetylmuramoyl-L-alanine amidase
VTGDKSRKARRAGSAFGVKIAVATLALALAGSVAASFAVEAQTAAPVAPLRAVDVHLQNDPDEAVLSFDFTGPVHAGTHALKDPDRIVVDLPAVGFAIDPTTGRDAPGKAGSSLIASFRFGSFTPNASRIVIDLTRPACVKSLDDKVLGANATASQLRIVLATCDRKAFEASLATDPPVSPADTPVAASADGTDQNLPLVVLDPGHGGIDGGAYGVNGAVEKSITLAFAQVLDERLVKSGRYRVKMTRDDDTFVSLPDRVKFARDAGASLFVSIHADTLTDSSGVSGATVYSGAERASDGRSARIAARENAADKAAGMEQKHASADVSDILFDLKMRESRAYTHLFSHGLVDAWRKAGGMTHNPERAANFYVLKAPDYPSVLIELGFVSNPNDVKLLEAPDWRRKTAETVAAAINAFFDRSASDAAVAPAPQATISAAPTP